jgi:hypothetical protein
MKTLIAVVMICSPELAVAQTAGAAAPNSAAPTTASAKIKPPKPICRKEDVTGSFFPARTCHTKEEWAAIDAANAKNAERISAARNNSGHM